MPKLTVLLGRKTIQVHDIDKSVIRIGREEEMDIIIDNPSVSRRHAEFRREGEGWVVEDLGSSNGTFMDGNKIESPCAVRCTGNRNAQHNAKHIQYKFAGLHYDLPSQISLKYLRGR